MMEHDTYKNNVESTEEYGAVYGKLITTFDHVTGRTLNYLDVIESIDQDTYDCLSVFTKNNNYDFDDDLMFNKFFYVDKIIIPKKYRGNGLGSILLEHIKYKFSDIMTAIVLQPLAFELNEGDSKLFELENERLCRFYERHEFKKYRDRTWVYHEC